MSELGRSWRPFWGGVTLATSTLVMAYDAFELLVPVLVAEAAACFGVELFAGLQDRTTDAE